MRIICREASLLGLARKGVIPQNNSKTECLFCDPVVLARSYGLWRLGRNGDLSFERKTVPDGITQRQFGVAVFFRLITLSFLEANSNKDWKL
jgi:hypothetical protein